MELCWGSSGKQSSPFMEMVSKQFFHLWNCAEVVQESSPPRLWKWLVSSPPRLWKWLASSSSIYGTVLG